MRPVLSCLLISALAVLTTGATDASARGGAIGGRGVSHVGPVVVRGRAFRSVAFGGGPRGAFRDGRRFGHFGPWNGGRFGHGFGRDGRCGFRGCGPFGGYGFYGLAPWGYGSSGYGSLGYGSSDYGPPPGGYRPPFGSQSGIPVAVGIPAPQVLPPAIYVIGSGRRGASRSATVARVSGGGVSVRSDDGRRESGVVSSGSRITRLR